MKTKWILQTNIFKEEAVDKMISCFQRQNIPYDLVKIIPFSNELPEGITEWNGPVIAYGTSTLLRLITKRKEYYPGMWFNEETFKPSVWGNKFGDKWLNKGSEVLKLHDVINHFTNKPLFLRPNSDFKLFSGDVFYKYEFEKWYERLEKGIEDGRYVNLRTNTEVTISQVKNILAEWRFVIIDKKVITYSRYKLNDRLSISAKKIDILDGALQLATEIAEDEWQISEAYVLDICQLVNSYKIIEVNCFNASGLYDCDAMNIVHSASELANKQWLNK